MSWGRMDDAHREPADTSQTGVGGDARLSHAPCVPSIAFLSDNRSDETPDASSDRHCKGAPEADPQHRAAHRGTADSCTEYTEDDEADG